MANTITSPNTSPDRDHLKRYKKETPELAGSYISTVARSRAIAGNFIARMPMPAPQPSYALAMEQYAQPTDRQVGSYPEQVARMAVQNQVPAGVQEMPAAEPSLLDEPDHVLSDRVADEMRYEAMQSEPQAAEDPVAKARQLVDAALPAQNPLFTSDGSYHA